MSAPAASGAASAPKLRRVIVVSDDEQMRSLLCELLIAHGYKGATGADTRGAAASRPRNGWDAAIVDTSVSYAESLRILRQLRSTCTAIVVIFSEGNGAACRRELAADDGLLLVGKPFDPRALLLVIRGMLDTASNSVQSGPSNISAGPLELSALSNRATVATREIMLTDIERRILCELIANASRPVPRTQLARCGLLRDKSADGRSLDTHINRLRRKLGTDHLGRTPIRTVRGVGYLLIANWEPP